MVTVTSVRIWKLNQRSIQEKCRTSAGTPSRSPPRALVAGQASPAAVGGTGQMGPSEPCPGRLRLERAGSSPRVPIGRAWCHLTSLSVFAENAYRQLSHVTVRGKQESGPDLTRQTWGTACHLGLREALVGSVGPEGCACAGLHAHTSGPGSGRASSSRLRLIPVPTHARREGGGRVSRVWLARTVPGIVWGTPALGTYGET